MNRIFSIVSAARNFALPLVLAALALGRRVVDEVLDFLNGDVAKAIAAFDKVDSKLERARMSAIRKATKLDEQIAAAEAQLEALEDAYDSVIGDAERAARVQSRIAQLTR